MKIGIVGAGIIGKTLSHKLSAAKHDVKIAYSRGPQMPAFASPRRRRTGSDPATKVFFVASTSSLNQFRQAGA